ncbi:nucleolar protein 9 isoform X2 [Polypterus senegalus]|uniref:nucleolar protein 9 isoform X2 n=1 Tax=Polypterus senegalus TaxID=55291 RepID=UPI001963B493|nr:nucleolar protein 9 isoform X2 [Polypterus senegalus]
MNPECKDNVKRHFKKDAKEKTTSFKKGKRKKQLVKPTDKEEQSHIKKLDPLSRGYFRRVSERLEEDFTTDEERDLFVANVFSEVNGQAVPLSMDSSGSHVLQRLLPLASCNQLCQLLKELENELSNGSEESHFEPLICHCCGAHIMETALQRIHRLRKTQDSEASADWEVLEHHILRLTSEVITKLPTFCKHTHGSFVVRALVQMLGGVLLEASNNKGQKSLETGLQDAPTSEVFSSAFKRLAKESLKHTKVFLTNGSASPVFQTILKVCHVRFPKLCQKLGRGMLDYLTSLNEGSDCRNLQVFFKDRTSSRLIENIVEVSQKSLFRTLYENHFKGHLVSLAQHPIANFPVQRIVASAPSPKLFRQIFDEMVPELESVFATKHIGVIIELAEGCIRHGERQAELLQHLLQVFHCAEPPSRQMTCACLFMTLLTYESYYQNHEPKNEAEQKQRPLSGVVYNGSRLVQTLLGFSDNTIVLRSLRLLPSSDLVTLACDPSGSHVLDVMTQHLNKKEFAKLLKKLKGCLIELACNKYGSRIMDKIWSTSDVSQKKSIAEDLAPHEARLRSDIFGHHIARNFALFHFLKRKKEWENIQTAQVKKRRMFNDILE